MFNLFNKRPIKNEAKEINSVKPVENKKEDINKEALSLVKVAREVLDLVLKDHSQANFHSQISGSQWNIDYLRDTEKKLEEMYKTNSFIGIPGIPTEVLNFQNDFNRFRYSNY